MGKYSEDTPRIRSQAGGRKKLYVGWRWRLCRPCILVIPSVQLSVAPDCCTVHFLSRHVCWPRCWRHLHLPKRGVRQGSLLGLVASKDLLQRKLKRCGDCLSCFSSLSFQINC